jgi:hypothetical protein
MVDRMIRSSSAEDARRSRSRYTNPLGDTSWVSSYFGAAFGDGAATPDDGRPIPETDVLYPVAFLVEFGPTFESKPDLDPRSNRQHTAD